MSPPGHNLVRTLRRRLGLTQKELAHLVGHTSESHVSRLERGIRAPGFAESHKLALVFRVPPAAIFTRLTHQAGAEVAKRVTQLNEKLLRSGCLQPQVAFKAGQLAEVLASLQRQAAQPAEPDRWSITAVPDDPSER